MDPPTATAQRAAVTASQRLELGELVLDLAAGELLRRDGQIAGLRRQALEVLLLLGRRAGQVVSRDELVQQVWPDVVVGDGSLTQAIADIRRLLGDAEHRIVRNVARRGYMLVATPASAAGTHAAAPTVAPVPRWRRHLGTLVAALALLVGVALWVAGTLPKPAAVAPSGGGLARDVPSFSVVVLPLKAEGDGQTAEWFADALLGDLIAEASRLHDSFVISRDTALTYKGREIDARAVARELGVRWVVRGRVRYADDRVHLAIELIDGETGAQRWSDTFDNPRAELQRMLEEFANRLARLLQLEIFTSNAARALKLTSQQVTADDLAMQGIALWLRGFTRDNVLQANDLFERAVVLDPKSQHGWGGINYTLLHALSNGWLADPAAGQRRLAEAWARLEQIDPDSYYGYQARVTRAYAKKDWPAMLALAQAWTERHRHAGAYAALGGALFFNDQPDEAVTVLERALRMSPREPQRAEWQYRLALAHYIAGRYAPARDWSRSAQRMNPGLTWPPIHAAALYELGDRAAAKEAFNEFAERHPRMDAAAIQQRLPGTTPLYVAARGRIIAALQELGLR